MAPALTPLERRRITALAVPMVAFTITSYVGNALAPTLIDEAPLLLLSLSPKLRWLLLTSPNVGVVWFFAVPLVRGVAVLVTYYLLGHWFGDRALRWLESRSGNALRPVRWVERHFHRARVPVTVLLPGGGTAMLAGADGMPATAFFATALTSITLRIWAVRALAHLFEGPLLDVLSWIGANQVWLTALSVAGVVVWVAWSNRHGIGPEETVEDVVEDFERAAEDPVNPPG